MADKAPKTHPRPPGTKHNGLSWHRGKGFWFKKLHGKQFRFGDSKDSEQAVRDFEAHKHLAEAGIPRSEWPDVSSANKPTMRDLISAWLDSKMDSSQRPDSGTKGGGIPEIETLCRRWAESIGAVHCETFRNQHLEGLIPTGQANTTTFRKKNHLREMLNSKIAERMGLLKLLLDLDEYVALETEDHRLATRVRTKRALTQREVRTLLEHANERMRCWILMGLNLSLGSSDLARLEPKDFDGIWLDTTREKRFTWRKSPMWPETQDAIERVKSVKNDHGLLLLTRDGGILAYSKRNGDHHCHCGHMERRLIEKGADWKCCQCGTVIPASKVRPVNQKPSIKDAPGEGFRKLAKRLVNDGLLSDPAITFGLLRHTFESRSAGLKSHQQLCVDLMMGHKIAGIGKWYSHTKPDKILWAISSELRQWLFPKAEPMPELVLDESYDDRFVEPDESFDE